jgi:hypothetical protein
VKITECAAIGAVPRQFDRRGVDLSRLQQRQDRVPTPCSMPRSVNQDDRSLTHVRILPDVSRRVVMNTLCVPRVETFKARRPCVELMVTS